MKQFIDAIAVLLIIRGHRKTLRDHYDQDWSAPITLETPTMNELQQRIKAIIGLYFMGDVNLIDFTPSENTRADDTANQIIELLVTDRLTLRKALEEAIGDKEYPCYEDGITVDGNGQPHDGGFTSSNMADHADYKTGQNAEKARMREAVDKIYKKEGVMNKNNGTVIGG